MSWNNAPEYDMNPEQRKNSIFRMFKTILVEEYISSEKIHDIKSKECSIKFQEGIIKKLENHGINSEYENEVLQIIKKISV